MSNFLGVASVTAVVTAMLDPVVAAAVAGARVTHHPPRHRHEPTDPPTLNLFMYQVTPNPALRNTDLPMRDASGQRVSRPRTPVDLQYLFTFYGDDVRLEPQRLLGATVRAMHENAVMPRPFIREVIERARRHVGPPGLEWLAGSNLDDQIEEIRFSPFPLDLEMISKFWTSFFHLPYVLSVAYQCSVVVIEGSAGPRPSLPVRTVRRSGRPVAPVRIRAVRPARAAVGDTLTIDTDAVLPADVRVAIGSRVADGAGDGRSVTLELTDDVARGLPAGAVELALIGADGTRSDSSSFTLVPTVVGHSWSQATVYDPDTGEARLVDVLVVDVAPPVVPDQPAEALLNQIDAPPYQAIGLPGLARGALAERVQFPIGDVPAGRYLLRISVGGVASDPTYVGDQFTGPFVDVPHG